MSEKFTEEKAEERAGLLRQGAGNYASLCGVLAGFVAVILVLASTPGFFQNTDIDVLIESVSILFSIASIGFIFTALGFINISSSPLWHYKSLQDMMKDYAFNQALVLLFLIIFLVGVTVLAFSKGALYMAITTTVGLIILASFLIKDWWALARRPPPKKKK